MANKPLSMLKLKRIIQLRHSGCNKLNISKQLGLNRRILDKYLKRIEETNKPLEELYTLSDADLNHLINPKKITVSEDSRYPKLMSLMGHIECELKKEGVTLKLLWEEYVYENEKYYGYTQFCEYFSRYKSVKSATMHIDREPGQTLEVDFTGSKLPLYDPITNQVRCYCSVMVATLSYSGLGYVEAMEIANKENLFHALNNALRYIGGVPVNIKSDNMRQFITINSRYEFSFTELGDQWALHYNTSLAASRPFKPKDKPVVEGGVKIAYLRIFARLRHERYYSLKELNKRIYELLEVYNETQFQKKGGLSRRALFEQHEAVTLRPLPLTDFTIKHKVKAKVQKNYHIILGEDNHQYSVPFRYIGKQVTVIYDLSEVEIFIGLERIALHARRAFPGGYTTIKEHMPQNHQHELEARGWKPEMFLAFADSIGPSTRKIFESVLGSRGFVEQNYKACLGLKRLTDSFGGERMEAACTRALPGKKTYGAIKSILEKGLDKQPNPFIDETTNPILHFNIRGKGYYC